MLKDAIGALLVLSTFIIVLMITDDSAAQDVRYCYDRSSYPTKVVAVCGNCQCPAGYY
jgi:hypothetical protein